MVFSLLQLTEVIRNEIAMRKGTCFVPFYTLSCSMFMCDVFLVALASQFLFKHSLQLCSEARAWNQGALACLIMECLPSTSRSPYDDNAWVASSQNEVSGNDMNGAKVITNDVQPFNKYTLEQGNGYICRFWEVSIIFIGFKCFDNWKCSEILLLKR